MSKTSKDVSLSSSGALRLSLTRRSSFFESLDKVGSVANPRNWTDPLSSSDLWCLASNFSGLC